MARDKQLFFVSDRIASEWRRCRLGAEWSSDCVLGRRGTWRRLWCQSVPDRASDRAHALLPTTDSHLCTLMHPLCVL